MPFFSLLILAFTAVTAQAAGLPVVEHCGDALPKARQTVETSPADLAALQVIAFCTNQEDSGTDGVNFSSKAKSVFEQSEFLRLVPELLDMARVKDLVPILREVETKGDKSVADYLMLNTLYEKLGEPEKQIEALHSAVAADPGDTRPLLLLASKEFAAGRVDEGRSLYRAYLDHPRRDISQAYMLAYVAGMAYPFPILASIVAGIFALGVLIMRRRHTAIFDELTATRRTKAAVWAVGALVPIGLALEFVKTGQALAFGLMIVILTVESLVLSWPYLRRIVVPVARIVGRGVGALFSVRFARVLVEVPTGWRALIAMTSMVAMGTVIPAISIPDVRYAVLVVCALLFFGTVGSLLVTLIRSSKSLRDSMRLIGVAATLPFLVIFVMTHWDEIGTPIMTARLPSKAATDQLVNYLIMWAVCVAFAVHLSKILADSLATPVREMMWKVSAIRDGKFEERVSVASKDEIGALAAAVNHMAEGLARREFVEKTFRRYVDGKVADRILNGGAADEVHIRGQKMHAVVMFADIRGFTSMSEGLQPEDVVMLLNAFFDRVVSAITAHGGIIDKFIGDSIMSVWGVPEPADHGERNAVAAALAMQASVAAFNIEQAKLGRPQIGLGVGINCGIIVAGSIGSSDRMEYTVIGDVVNTAQRTESAAKPGQILVSDRVYETLTGELEVAGTFIEQQMKGKAQPVKIWHVTGLKAAKLAAA